MSLIEEALRRIQDPTLTKSQAGQATAPATKAPAAQTPGAHSWQAAASGNASPGINPLTAVGLSVLALAVLLVAGALVWVSRSFTPGTQPAQVASRASSRVNRALELTPPPPPAPGLPDPITLTNQSLLPEPKEAATFTMPWVRVQPKPKDFILSGVVEGTGESYAVINDMIIGVGDSVEGAQLVSITKGAVTLQRTNGQEIVLRIEQ